MRADGAGAAAGVDAALDGSFYCHGDGFIMGLLTCIALVYFRHLLFNYSLNFVLTRIHMYREIDLYIYTYLYSLLWYVVN